MTDDARPSECVCKENKEESTLKCTECTRRVHWTCTELPVYQLCVFIKTHRRYTCRPCAKAYMDDSTTEEVELAKTVTQTTDKAGTLHVTTLCTASCAPTTRPPPRYFRTWRRPSTTWQARSTGRRRSAVTQWRTWQTLYPPAIKTGSQRLQLTNQHRRPRRRQPIRPSRLTGLYR